MRILVESRPTDGDWIRIGRPIAPVDPKRTGTAVWNGEWVTVAYGWDAWGVPRVWVGDNPPHLTLIADLRAGPYEMSAPYARWRWSLIEG